MYLSEELKDIVEDIVSSYDFRVESIGSVLDATSELIEGFQDSFLDAKQEREAINAQVRDILARNEHLRKRDFDSMMRGILSVQEEREKAVRELLRGYFNEQKETAHALKENLAEFKDSLAGGEAQRVREFRVFVEEISEEQRKRKEEVISSLKEFQREQREIAGRLRELLDKGRDLRIKDLRAMLRECKILCEERLVRQKERKEEIRSMLGGFRKDITERARTRQTAQTGPAHK